VVLAASLPLRAGAATLTVTPASLPTGEVGSTYSHTLTATGGSEIFSSWAITVGTLPAGLALNTSTGAITGTPTAAGTLSFTAQVTDSALATASAALSITVNPAIAITTASLPHGEVGAAYSETLLASGGIAPFAWSISVGSLPAGLSLNASSGMISGTPTTAGDSPFTAMVTDGVLHSSTMALSITVDETLAVTTVSLANGAQGISYTQTLAAIGGLGPYTWSISVGTLPAGLSPNSSTGAVTGTPTTIGTSPFTVMVTDSLLRTATKALSITVSSGLAVATTSLPGGTASTAYSQTVTAVGGVAPYSWGISLGSLPAGLSLSGSTGVISGTPTTVQSSPFTVMVIDAASHTATQALSIAVTAAGTPAVTPLGGPGGGSLTTRVQAACDPAAIAALAASEQKVETALCAFFTDSQLSPSVTNAVGHLILKIAGVMGKGEDKDDPSSHPAGPGDDHGNGGDHGKGDDPSPTATATPAATGARFNGDPRPSQTPTITPTHTATSVINHLSISPTPKGRGNSEKGPKH
jgi:hypothetical protein